MFLYYNFSKIRVNKKYIFAKYLNNKFFALADDTKL